MKIDWKKFAEIAKVVAPVVLATVTPKLAPLGTVIGHSIAEAEAIPGASGPDKLAHVKAIASDTVDAINNASDNDVISHEDLDNLLDHGINTAVEVINVIAKAKTPNVGGQPVQ